MGGNGQKKRTGNWQKKIMEYMKISLAIREIENVDHNIILYW